MEYSHPIIEGEGFTLPTSSNVRSKAQDVLEALYNDFYKILVTLKNTTDSLNVYLSNPEEERPSGQIAAQEAGKLETEIIQTTD